jgi:uncharacterized membrane protein
VIRIVVSIAVLSVLIFMSIIVVQMWQALPPGLEFIAMTGCISIVQLCLWIGAIYAFIETGKMEKP